MRTSVRIAIGYEVMLALCIGSILFICGCSSTETAVVTDEMLVVKFHDYNIFTHNYDKHKLLKTGDRYDPNSGSIYVAQRVGVCDKEIVQMPSFDLRKFQFRYNAAYEYTRAELERLYSKQDIHQHKSLIEEYLRAATAQVAASTSSRVIIGVKNMDERREVIDMLARRIFSRANELMTKDGFGAKVTRFSMEGIDVLNEKGDIERSI